MTKRGKHCGKRRNCMFCAISSFVTMFSNSRLLQRRQKVSIWGKGLSYAYITANPMIHSFYFNKSYKIIKCHLKTNLWHLLISQYPDQLGPSDQVVLWLPFWLYKLYNFMGYFPLFQNPIAVSNLEGGIVPILTVLNVPPSPFSFFSHR